MTASDKAASAEGLFQKSFWHYLFWRICYFFSPTINHWEAKDSSFITNDICSDA
jgi:hypothetical protein